MKSCLDIRFEPGGLKSQVPTTKCDYDHTLYTVYSHTRRRLLYLSLYLPQSLIMPPQTFFLVSLPTSVSPADSRDEALTTLRSAVSTDQGTTYPFAIPEFKIGTLDALVQQADELVKLEQGCKGVVDKVADSLRSLLEGDEEKLQEQKVVNDSAFNRPPWWQGA